MQLHGVVDMDKFLNDIIVMPSFVISAGAACWDPRAWSMVGEWVSGRGSGVGYNFEANLEYVESRGTRRTREDVVGSVRRHLHCVPSSLGSASSSFLLAPSASPGK